MPNEQWRDEFRDYAQLLEAIADGDRLKVAKVFSEYLKGASPGSADSRAPADPDEEESGAQTGGAAGPRSILKHAPAKSVRWADEDGQDPTADGAGDEGVNGEGDEDYDEDYDENYDEDGWYYNDETGEWEPPEDYEGDEGYEPYMSGALQGQDGTGTQGSQPRPSPFDGGDYEGYPDEEYDENDPAYYENYDDDYDPSYFGEYGDNGDFYPHDHGGRPVGPRSYRGGLGPNGYGGKRNRLSANPGIGAGGIGSSERPRPKSFAIAFKDPFASTQPAQAAEAQPNEEYPENFDAPGDEGTNDAQRDIPSEPHDFNENVQSDFQSAPHESNEDAQPYLQSEPQDLNEGSQVEADHDPALYPQDHEGDVNPSEGPLDEESLPQVDPEAAEQSAEQYPEPDHAMAPDTEADHGVEFQPHQTSTFEEPSTQPQMNPGHQEALPEHTRSAPEGQQQASVDPQDQGDYDEWGDYDEGGDYDKDGYYDDWDEDYNGEYGEDDPYDGDYYQPAPKKSGLMPKPFFQKMRKIMRPYENLSFLDRPYDDGEDALPSTEDPATTRDAQSNSVETKAPLYDENDFLPPKLAPLAGATTQRAPFGDPTFDDIMSQSSQRFWAPDRVL